MLDQRFFATTQVHARTVTLPDGTAAELHFRELPSVELRRQHLAETSDDQATREAAVARLISVGLCDAEGQPVITVEQAANLKPTVSAQMLSHILEVCGFGGVPAPGKD